MRWFRNLFFLLMVAAPGCKEKTKPPVAPRAKVTSVVSPELPAKRIYAKRFVVTVRNAPHLDAQRLGYLRAGAQLQAKTHQPVGNVDCPGGWYELSTGGFVCVGKDVAALEKHEKPPERPPSQPNFNTALPYAYGHTRKRGTPMYKRIPTEAEVALFEPPKEVSLELDAGASVENISAVPAQVSQISIDAGEPIVSATNDAGLSLAMDAGLPTLDSLKGERRSVLVRYLERGFLVSLDREMEVSPRNKRKYWRTMSNGYVPFGSLYLLQGSSFSGKHLDATVSAMGAGFVESDSVWAFQMSEEGRLQRKEQLGHRVGLAFVEEQRLRNTLYYKTADHVYVRARDVVHVRWQNPPAGLEPNGKWIDIDLAKQTLVAYEGTRPVFATLVSTGKVKDENDPLLNHETPLGDFRITSKHVTHTMDGDHAVDGPYSIEDVPYVMYFQLAYAIHSAFWHNKFGHPKSHGCVNMAPRDAKWLFAWTDPPLPQYWHGVYPTEQSPRTRVIVRGETPRR